MLASSDEGSLLAESPREPSEPWIRPGCTGASTGEISPVDSPGDAPPCAPRFSPYYLPSASWSGTVSNPYEVHKEPRDPPLAPPSDSQQYGSSSTS